MKKLLILPLCLLAVLLDAADRKVNAALIALNKQAEMFCDLLLGVYGETLPVTFLERTSRTALEQEFRLNQTGLLSGDWQPSERHLEKAELFFVAESRKKTTRILIFDGRRGIRLVDCDLVRKDALISAASGAELLKLALNKQQDLPTAGMQKLAFMPLLPVHLSTENERAARGFLTRLERGILTQRNAVLLERKHLQLLLSEPGKHDLLKGTVIFRTTAREKDGKLSFEMELVQPDGKTLGAPIRFDYAPGEDELPDFAKLLKHRIESATGNKEAQMMISQAYFALEHGLSANALTLASASAVLSQKQELAFADVVFRTAFRQSWLIWKEPEMIRQVLLAARILEKQKRFQFYAMRFCTETLALSPERFAELSPEMRQEVEEIAEILVALALQDLEKRQRDEFKSSKFPASPLYSIHKRAEYLNCMDNICAYHQWNLKRYARYVLPELKEFIRESNAAVPELENFFSLSADERLKQISRRNINYMQSTFFALFFNCDLSSQTPGNKAVLRELFTLLAQSKLLGLAWRGEWGLMRLDENGKNKAEVTERYNQALVRCFETCSLPERYATHLELQGPVSTHTALKLLEISIRRFAFYDPLNGSIMNQQFLKTLSRKDAVILRDELYEYWKNFQNDPRVGKFPSFTYTLKNRASDVRMIEDEFQLPSKMDSRIVPESPFSASFTPLKKLKTASRGRISEPCMDDRYLVFAVWGNHVNGKEEMQLVKMDMENDFAPTYGKPHPVKTGWAGTDMNGLILDGYYIFQNARYVYLCPLDGGEVRELDFGLYYNNSSICMTGIDGRLFLSYGQWAGHQKPGSVIEYDLKNGKTRLIASTLDQSVKWPLQGKQNWPYHIHQLVPDATNHRVLMLLHTGPFAYGYSPPPMRVYAYDYKNCSWEELSGDLPCGTGTDGKIFLDKERIFLMLRDYGAGLIRPNKVWSPVIMKDRLENCLTDKKPRFYRNRKMAVDYSSPAQIPGIRWGRDTLDLHDYSDGLIYGTNGLLDLKNNFYYPFKISFYGKLIGRKYLVQWSSYAMNRGNALHLHVFKPLEQLRREAAK